MLKILLIILFCLVVVVAIIAILASMQPSHFRYERSAAINATPEAIFAQVNDFHKWEAWSPWAKLDPDAKNSFSGPALGEGASFAWDGNSKVGAGSMTITESKPPQSIRIRLDFLKPFKGTNTAEFTFQPQGSQILVTWAMWGENTFPGKVMGLFINCDKMAGGMFEKGLAALKAIVEKPT